MQNILEKNTLDYLQLFEEMKGELSIRELKLLEEPNISSEQEAAETVEKLNNLGFIRCEGGSILTGIDEGLICKVEGHRNNETPRRQIIDIPSFYVSKTTVTNIEYEKFDPKHQRPASSKGDKHPVTCITYGHAISYALWLKLKTGLSFRLPTEPEFIMFSAPDGWLYPYQEAGEPTHEGQNSFMAFPHDYLGSEAGTLPVDSIMVSPNHLGIFHPTGNVATFTLGHYLTQQGHWGSSYDGAYTIVSGGSFRQCPQGGRTVTRGIIDVAAITDTIGVRLVHPDPFNYLISNEK